MRRFAPRSLVPHLPICQGINYSCEKRSASTQKRCYSEGAPHVYTTWQPAQDNKKIHFIPKHLGKNYPGTTYYRVFFLQFNVTA